MEHGFVWCERKVCAIGADRKKRWVGITRVDRESGQVGIIRL